MDWLCTMLRDLLVNLLGMLMAIGGLGFVESDGQSTAQPRSAGSLAVRMLADRPDDWITVAVPVVRIHFQQGTAPGAERSTFADLVTAARRDVLALLNALQRGLASVLERWQGAVDSRAP